MNLMVGDIMPILGDVKPQHQATSHGALKREIERHWPKIHGCERGTAAIQGLVQLVVLRH